MEGMDEKERESKDKRRKRRVNEERGSGQRMRDK